MKDLFGEEVATEPEKPVKAARTAGNGLVAPAKAEAVVPFRPYVIVRESKTAVWLLHTD